MVASRSAIPFRWLAGAIEAALIVGVLCAVGCGPSAEEGQVSKKGEQASKQALERLSAKHNSIVFPPEKLQPNAYTYELQEFFEQCGDRSILLRGCLEDVERKDRGVVVVFLCPLDSWIGQGVVRLELVASDAALKQILQEERLDLPFRELALPDHFVVAKVGDVRRAHLYRVTGHAEEEVCIPDLGATPMVIATGVLIEAVSIPQNER